METRNTPFSLTSLTLLCAMIVLTPLARGGVHLWVKSLIQIFTLAAVIALVLERLFKSKNSLQFKLSPLSLPIAALLLLVIISAILSPHGSLSMEGSMMFITYILIYHITLNAVRSRREQRVVIYVIIGTALLISMIGLLKTSGVNPFSWWEYPGLNSPHFITGTYGNHNHMAGFMEMSIPMLLVLFMTRSRSREVIVGMVSLLLFLLVVQGMTLSRGGWASCALSLLFMFLVLMLQKRFEKKRMLTIIAVAVVVTGVVLLASTPVIERLITLTRQDTEESMTEGRTICWQGTIEMIGDHYMTGTGPGTYEEAYTQYQPAGFNSLFNQAHNDYLEILSNLGIGVIPIVIWMLFLFYKSCFKKMESSSRQTRAVSLGVMAAVFAILVHSLGDFNLHIPANAVLFSILCALGTGTN